MKKWFNRNLWREIGVITIFFFAIEIFFRVLMQYEIVDYSVIRILLSCFTITTMCSLLFSFIKKKRIRERIAFFLLFIVSLYAFLQIGFKNYLGLYISLGASSQAGAVKTYIADFFASYKWRSYLIWIPFLLYTIYFFLPKKWDKKEQNYYSWKNKITLIFCTLVLMTSYYITLTIEKMQNPIQIIPNIALIKNPTSSAVAVNQFGTTVYGLIDVKQLLLPSAIMIDHEEKEETKDQIRTFDDTLWKEITSEEKNRTIKTLHKYFLSRKIEDVNEYTGYFKGKNVIFIMMETVNNTFLMKQYFPNFANMLQHSWYFENNYSPRNSCATGDNEFSGLTSLYALNSVCTANGYQNNTYFTSAFNRFKSAGYSATSYHNYDVTYYARDISHPNMGSQHFYDAASLGIDLEKYHQPNWPSDVDLVESASKIFLKNKPFMVWMTTVTGHFPYTVESEFGNKYLDILSDSGYPIEIQRYISKLKVTDDALGKLIKILEENNELEDTVIVMYGDHYPYGMGDDLVQQLFDYDIEEFYEKDRVPFAIYNPSIEGKVFKQKTSYMNILPTIANLFDLDYDPRFYMGEDLFSPNFSGRVVFADSSWEDDIARYDSNLGKITYFGSETYSIEELRKINSEIAMKKQMSKLAIENNYFEVLQRELQKKQEEQ